MPRTTKDDGRSLRTECRHQGTRGHEKCNIARLKLLYIWTNRAALCLKPPYAHANINIKFYLVMYQIGSLLWFMKTSHVWSLICCSSLPLANELKIIHPAYSGRLSFVPGKTVAAEHWLCRMHISVPWAKGSLVGIGSISIYCSISIPMGMPEADVRALNDSLKFSAKWYVKFPLPLVTAGKHYRMV